MSLAEIITQKLSEALSPSFINVEDESYKHAGHAGSRDDGETHFAVEITSDKFTGLSRIQRHQLIYDLLKEYMNNPIHALAIKAK